MATVNPGDKFSISGALSAGWAALKADPFLVIGAMVITGLIPLIFSFVGAMLPDTLTHGFFALVGTLIHYLLTMALSAGLTRIYLNVIDAKPTQFSDLIQPWPVVMNYTITGILTHLVVSVGLFLLVIPGIFFMIIFYFSGFTVVDEGLSPTDALRRSAELTRGARWTLLGFGFVILLINLLGLLCLGIGLLITVPVTLVATVSAFRQLQAGTGPAQKIVSPI